MSERSTEPSPNQINESAACDVCGRFGAVEFGDRKVCADCFQGCGACCSESGREESP